MSMDETRGVCKDRSRRRYVVSVYPPLGKGRSICMWVCVYSKTTGPISLTSFTNFVGVGFLFNWMHLNTSISYRVDCLPGFQNPVSSRVTNGWSGYTERPDRPTMGRFSKLHVGNRACYTFLWLCFLFFCVLLFILLSVLLT